MNTRINKQEVWTAGVGQTPVWRDGLDSTLTYLLIAVKQAAEVYNCVCVRRLDQTYFKVKFYPSMEYWSIDEQQLSEFGFSEYRSRVDTHQYERMTCKSHEAMEKLTEHLAKLRKTNAVQPLQYFPVLRSGEGKDQSVILHPKRGGEAAQNPRYVPDE